MKPRTWLWAVGAVLLVAMVLRASAFGRVPPGLYRDEAMHGLDALDLLDGRLSLYFPANNGREPLYIYLTALSVALFGRSSFALRLPSLFVGVATVASTAAMGRALFSRRVGVLGAAVLAVTLWHVHLSRTGFRAVLLPLVASLSIWQGAEAIRNGRLRSWVVSGALCGLCAYTYTAARLIPLALGAFAAYTWLAWPRSRLSRVRRLWLGAGTAALAGLVVAGPLLALAVCQPEVVLGRPGQVSVFSPHIHGGSPLLALGDHWLKTLGMFFVRGDRIWRHNVPWRPVFDPVLGLAFVAGLLTTVRQARRDPAAVFTLIWSGTLLLATILAEDAPHFLRAVGVLPVVVLIPALGIEAGMSSLAGWIGQRTGPGVRARVSTAMSGVAASLVVTAGLVSTASAYFVDYASDPTTAYWFEDGAVQLAGHVNRFLRAGWDGTGMLHDDPDGRHAYIDPKLWSDWAQVRFLVRETGSVTVGTTPVPDIGTAAAFAWSYNDWGWVWGALPGPPREIAVELGPLSQGDRDPAPYRTYVAVVSTMLGEAGTPLARFTGGVEYLGSELSSVGDQLQVRLRWRATEALDTDYIVFLHYLRDGEMIGQGDAGAASGLYPTSRWQPGDVINDNHPLEGVGVPLPGRDVLRFGFWHPESGQVLYLLDDAGNPAADWLDVPVGG
jgi:4-amino-4-deoxy-L-arabinose transferase-like glycosyltransferase